MSRKTKALLLSALVLPGLGQVYLGRKVAGMALIMLVNLLILAALFAILKVSSPVIAARLGAGNVNAAELLAVLNNAAGFGKGVLAAFILLWAYSIVDILRSRPE